MIEYETIFDGSLEVAALRTRTVEQRAARIAIGDFQDPADEGLDDASVRLAIHNRRIGRLG
jgi:hypothetical protein